MTKRMFFDLDPRRNQYHGATKYKSDSDVFQFFANNFTNISMNGFSAAAMRSMNVFWSSLPHAITGKFTSVLLSWRSLLCYCFVA